MSAATGKRRHPLCVALLGLAGLSIVLSAGRTAEAMRDEDIVVLFVGGATAAQIIERIHAAEDVAFDLSEEMIAELRIAGLAEEVIQAMIARQNELHPPEPEAEPIVVEVDTNLLTVILNPPPETEEERPRPSLRLAATIGAATSEALRLRATDARFTDLAIALICRTPTHVPDHWRSQSPLGRDFISAPRHRLLAFFPGAAVEGDQLVLEIPAQIEVKIEPDETHDLTLAIAAEAEDRFFLIASDGWDGLVLDAAAGTLTAELTGEGPPQTIAVLFRR